MTTVPMTPDTHPSVSSRRSFLRFGTAAGVAAAATMGAVGHVPAAAAAGTGGFAGAPTGTDDTALLRDAMSTGKILGPGTYVCRSAIDLATITLVGTPGMTIIKVLSPSFIDTSTQWGPVRIEGIRFEGNPAVTKTFIRNRYAGGNVNFYRTITDCMFTGYTGAAIAMNQIDNPYVNIERCIFWGANSTTTVGIALNGDNANSNISNNAFLSNRIGISVAMGGIHTRITQNDFIQYGTGSKRVGIWIQPHTQRTNAGQGLLIRDNKFGNENRAADDFCILYADKGPALGASAAFTGDFGPRMGPSTGYVALQEISGNDFSGAGATMQSPVVTYTPNFLSTWIGPNRHAGTTPAIELLFAGGLPSKPTGTTVDPGRHWYPDVPSVTIQGTNAPATYVRTVTS